MTDSFTVRLEGQPPSVNSSYRSMMSEAKDRNGMPIYNRYGVQAFRPRTYKVRTVKEYQQGIIFPIRAARPSTFTPSGMVYVVYDLFVNRDVDADNVFKAINDTLALVLGINDKFFLSVARSKQTGIKEPYVNLTVLDATAWTVSVERR